MRWKFRAVRRRVLRENVSKRNFIITGRRGETTRRRQVSFLARLCLVADRFLIPNLIRSCPELGSSLSFTQVLASAGPRLTFYRIRLLGQLTQLPVVSVVTKYFSKIISLFPRHEPRSNYNSWLLFHEFPNLFSSKYVASWYVCFKSIKIILNSISSLLEERLRTENQDWECKIFKTIIRSLFPKVYSFRITLCIDK